MGIATYVGALAVTALVGSATAAPPPVASAADTTVLALCGVTCPKWRDADIDVIIDQFIEPIYPDDTFETVAVTAPGELWPLTGVARLLLSLLADPRLGGPGGGSWPDEPWWKLSGLFDLTANQSVQVGAAALEEAMAENPSDHQVIYGYSQGAGVANVVKKRLAAQFPGADAPDIDFVLGGDPNLPNGGLMSRFAGFYIPILDFPFNGPAVTDTQFETVEINRQYDGFVDFPLYPLNLVATLNAVLGIAYMHGWPFDVSLPSPDPTESLAYQGHFGDTDYYFFESEDLPLFGPLRSLGVPERFIDVIEPFFRVLVELGYDRSIDPWTPTPARLIPRVDPAKVLNDLGDAIGEGFDNALALIGVPPLHGKPAPVTAEEPGMQGARTAGVPAVTSADPDESDVDLDELTDSTDSTGSTDEESDPGDSTIDSSTPDLDDDEAEVEESVEQDQVEQDQDEDQGPQESEDQEDQGETQAQDGVDPSADQPAE